MIAENICSGEAKVASTPPILSQFSASTQDCVPLPELLEENFENLKNFDLEVEVAIACCLLCGYARFYLVQMPSDCIHYAARRCGECDRFLGWQAKPKTQEKRQRWQTTIDRLLQAQKLTAWEYEFLLSVRGRKSLSLKQQAVVNRIETKVGGVV